MSRKARRALLTVVADSPHGYFFVRPRARAWALLPLVAFVAALVALTAASGGGPVAPAPAIAAGGPDTGQILVKFKPNAAPQAIDALNAANGAVQVDEIAAIGVKVLRLPGGGSSQAAANVYARNPLVQFAEPNALVAPQVIPNDPNFGSEWHLAKIQAPTAWDSAKATGVMIAICDTGVASVADLAPVLRGDLGWNAVDGTTNWGDSYGHGTLVAGAAAAAANNATGVAGVGWGAQVVPVRISNFTDGSAYVSDAAKCVNYAADHGARVINLSYLMAGSSTIDQAGQYAQGKGAVTVVAAGNNATNPGWPNYPGLLAVSGTTDQDKLAVWSNYGTFIDVAAPGLSIMTTRMDGSYGYASGTSLAAPVASGVLALIFGANPGLSASQAQALLLSSADDLGLAGWDASFGSGRVNANRAVAAARGGSPATPTATSTPSPTSTATSAPQPSSTPTVTATTGAPSPTPASGDTVPPTVALASPAQGQSVRGNVTLSAAAADNVAVVRVDFLIDGVLLRGDASSPYNTAWNTRKWANGSHTLIARAYDAAGNWAQDTLLVNVAN